MHKNALIGRSKQKQQKETDSQKDINQNLERAGLSIRRRSQNNTPVIPSPGAYEDIAVVGKSSDDHSTVLNVVGQHYSAPTEPILHT